MYYLPPFESIKRRIPVTATEGTVRINMAYDEFLLVLKLILQSVPVDEDWYRRTYPDVAGALTEGVWSSAREHFVEHGYFEGRMPYEMRVDEAWYLQVNEDVQRGVISGEHASAQEHFAQYGYEEGRMPMPPTKQFQPTGKMMPPARDARVNPTAASPVPRVRPPGGD